VGVALNLQQAVVVLLDAVQLLLAAEGVVPHQLRDVADAGFVVFEQLDVLAPFAAQRVDGVVRG